MGIRKLPFGYMMRFGKIVEHPIEAECVRDIFKEYLRGQSFSRIAESMSERGIPYDADKAWNKNMVARILENSKYTGADEYPELIKRECFEAAAAKRAAMHTDTRRTDLQKTLRLLCGQTVSESVERQVVCLVGTLINHPELVQPPKSCVQDDGRVTELRRQLRAVLGVLPVDEEQATQLIFELASAEYDAIGSEEYETVRIRRVLQNGKGREVNAELLRSCIRQIKVTGRTISIKLKNGQIVKGE